MTAVSIATWGSTGSIDLDVSDSPKPPSIVAFDRFFWTGMLLSVLEILLSWDELTAPDPSEPEMTTTISIAIIMLVVAAMLFLMIFLRYGIDWKINSMNFSK